MNLGFLFEMDTSMLGRVVAMLNQDHGRSRVIFLALARGQELIVFVLITGSMWSMDLDLGRMPCPWTGKRSKD